MGGVFADLGDWRAKYGVGYDEALANWIAERDQIMRNPFNLNYVFQSGMKDTSKVLDSNP